LAEGQSLPFPIDFEGRPYNNHTIVWGVMIARWRRLCTLDVCTQKIPKGEKRCVLPICHWLFR